MDIFLTEEDIRVDEKDANREVVVTDFPELVGE
jgi:hypothetical protein